MSEQESPQPQPLVANSVSTTDNTEGRLASRSSRIRKREMVNPLVGVIDAGTSNVSFHIYITPEFKEVATHSVHLNTISPQDGWYEQDPIELMETVYKCCTEALNMLPGLGLYKEDLITIGITNQRETTVVWDATTGLPLYNALVWKDIRSSVTVDQVLAKIPDKNKDHFKSIAGLPVSPYFSALKIRWLHDNVPAVRKAFREKRCKAGTIDSWIVWNLTNGSLHITDVTNASRTLLMNIETLNWDPVLLKTFSIPVNMLPEIRSCSEVFGTISNTSCMLEGVRISGIMGNQQAALLGQMCMKRGQAKNSYRSGCFLLCNIGREPIISSHGLLTTVAYKLGPDAPTYFALEGAVAVAGHALHWLQNKVRVMPDVAEAENLAQMVKTTGDVYFVPAFTGLYAPYWRKDARGIIIGLTQFTTKAHIVRAALEAICFQTRDILECMHVDIGAPVKKLYADGALTANELLLQLQADTAGLPVLRSQLIDTTAFGTAMCAGQAQGVNLCSLEPHKRFYENAIFDTYLPTTTDEERSHRYGRWKRAVERSMGWVIASKTTTMTDERYRMLSSVPPAIFLITAFAMLAHAAMAK